MKLFKIEGDTISQKIDTVLYRLGAYDTMPPHLRPKPRKIYLGRGSEEFLQAIEIYDEKGRGGAGGDIGMVLTDYTFVSLLQQAELIFDFPPPNTNASNWKELWEEEKMYFKRLLRKSPFPTYIAARREIENIGARPTKPLSLEEVSKAGERHFSRN